ncbi:MAG: DUF5618 family protein [Chitinispirillales bacterium]|jgi:hypothetical protein|nr:DUF5618 family protein [Chitinispirillales bacterium]
MTTEEQKAFKAKEYAEAVRYMDNAKDDLSKTKKDGGGRYTDKKYVRRACGTAYSGILVALDAWLTLKGVDVSKRSKKQRKSIDFYTSNLTLLDKKLLSHLLSAYEILHLFGYYDGTTNVKVISTGFDEAYKIIDKIKPAEAHR